MATDLTILCITAGRDHAETFLGGMNGVREQLGCELLLLEDGTDVHSGGYIESVLDESVERCSTRYVLRLDDDECLDNEAIEWLETGAYREADHWAFRRRNLWPDLHHYISNPPLWPDLQTRLSTKEKAGARPGIHSGSPFGTGSVAPGAIHHYKFLVRPKEEREALLARYENIAPGAGSQFVMFSLPERYEGLLKCEPVVE